MHYLITCTFTYRYLYLTERFGLTSGVSGQAVLLLSTYVLVLAIVLAAISDSFVYLRWRLVHRIDKRGKEEGRTDRADLT